MSFKNVLALRKAGRLEEAIAMARADINKNRDEWSCKALFWCLHEKTKTADFEHLTLLTDEMRDLLTSMNGDSIATECMQRIEKRLIPHSEEIRNLSEQSKIASKAMDAFDSILNIFNAGELHISLHTDFAWVIYRALHADQSENVELRKRLIEVYKDLDIVKPSVIHSLILNEAVRVEKEWPQMFMFTEFILWWDLNNLTDDDWERFVTTDGIQQLSRVEKMIYLYTKEILSVANLQPSADFMSVIDKVIGKWPDDDNLLRCKALLIAKQGDRDGAIALYKKLIAMSSGQKCYIWNELSDLVDNKNLKIGLLSKAILLKTKEEFLGKIRAQLAQLLYDNGQVSNALYEVEKVKATYAEKQWNLPLQVKDLIHVIPHNTKATDNTTQYALWAKTADEYLYNNLPIRYMVKVAHREESFTKNGQQRKDIKWFLTDREGNTERIHPNKYNLAKANIGECFTVRCFEDKIVSISPTDKRNVTWQKSIQGFVSIKTNKEGKKFGFVDNCYVPEKLAQRVTDGAFVECIAICQNDKWRCIDIYHR